ncbi:2-oxo-4-hydroxy-4-carboxy-5-ureidoimidazoline decarboxylase [Glycomyces harbinensis]|uniref:2-oxo-4-hydroxy-4-carboxy-5-ureidoimidazoline decarboxylase n=1 Tax=Glycomyces harbinensis TaxID=58114 RepID=A0A1G7BPB6_9ACTN|nr:2-oxo-4-hydroxy-4-carboxy-5-ureidoimidazoline decarboxylase [Glycomyces harbinensis]SDE28793.1 2-oxo-4-hydroxy-4-carboxy-5-ureidoimidazoline decarboxylase [Glycomyces harbinensis]
MWTLRAFNAMDAADAVRVLTACCASQSWAEKVATGRPYGTVASLKAAALAAFDELDDAELAVAHAAHPPIGKPRPAEGADWSRGEQSRALASAEAVRAELAEVNAAYEHRFGRVFLICATGLTGEEILAEARRRLAGDDRAEAAASVAELRKITALRLDKSFGAGPAATAPGTEVRP